MEEVFLVFIVVLAVLILSSVESDSLESRAYFFYFLKLVKNKILN